MQKKTSALTSRLKSWPLYLVPHQLISRITYAATRSKTALTRPFIRYFIRKYGVDMSEALHHDISAYEHFNAFFTRALKPELRPINHSENTLVSPVDGTISQIGLIRHEQIFQAKGHDYSLTELLGGDKTIVKPFIDGRFATLYLSPRDYHRIHAPYNGQLLSMIHIPGRLFSVAPYTARTIPRLFARNERLITLFETDIGKLAVILVGAINVGSMEMVWHGQVTPPYGRQINHYDYTEAGITLKKGQELGRFNMGSTVIILTESKIHWQEDLCENSPLKFGQAIAVAYQ